MSKRHKNGTKNCHTLAHDTPFACTIIIYSSARTNNKYYTHNSNTQPGYPHAVYTQQQHDLYTPASPKQPRDTSATLPPHQTHHPIITPQHHKLTNTKISRHTMLCHCTPAEIRSTPTACSHVLPPRSGEGVHPLRPKSPRRRGEAEESSSAPRLGRPSLRGGRDSIFPSATLARARTSGAAVVRGGDILRPRCRAGYSPNTNPSIHGDIIRPRAGG